MSQRTLTSSPKAATQTAEQAKEPFLPLAPHSLEEASLSPTLVEQLILKNLYFRGEVLGRDLAKVLGLRFSVIEPVLEFLKRTRFIEVKRSTGFGAVSSVFATADTGRARAKEYLESNQFVGPAPVPLRDYIEAVRRQKVSRGWMTREVLEKAFAEAVVTDEFFSSLGPAVNSFKSLLIYGKPGNGKTFLAEQLNRTETEPIFIPYVVEADGQIIKVFDSLYHGKVEDEEEKHLVENEPKYDMRWARCRRPFLTTGGELTLNMLDLMYIESAKIYDAPYQLKANNGMYLIDDFGRQQITPAELLNRWIYPLDRGVDYLTFHTGNKIEVPFECFLIFSSNLNPSDLGDEAFLRRLEYKMYMRNPNEEEFAAIFYDYCRMMKIECPMGLLTEVIFDQYKKVGRKFRRCHPRDVISVAIDLIRFEKLPFVLNKELLYRAFDLKFVTTGYDADD
jgi:predicted ATPase with chaperone activity